MSFSFKLATLLYSVCMLLPAAAQAQFARAEDAIEYRNGAFFVMDYHYDRIGDMVKGKIPYDKAVAESDAAIIETLGKLPWHAFTPNSITENSRAKEEIWQQKDKFKAAADKMQAETTKLVAASKTGDFTKLKTAFLATSQTCKECHDTFRKKKK